MKYNLRSEFNRNVLQLLLGSTLGQALPLLAMPLITRIYTPGVLGVYGIFIGITAIFSVVVCGRYELAILLPKRNSHAINLSLLCFSISACVSVLFFFIVVIFKLEIVKLLGLSTRCEWVYLLPFAVLISGWVNILTYINTRAKKFRNISRASILKGLVAVFAQLTLGYILRGSVYGLIMASVFSQIAQTFILFLASKEHLTNISVNRHKVVYLAKKYINFSKYSVPAALANAISFNLVNVLIARYYSIVDAGYYTLLKKLMGTPGNIIGRSIGHVYFQEASEAKRRTGSAREIFKTTVAKLACISASMYFVVMILPNKWYHLFFGEKWIHLGTYSKILAVYFGINFIVSAVSHTNTVFEKQKNGLIINIILFISFVVAVGVSHSLNISFESFLGLFTVLMSLSYMGIFIYYWKLAGGKDEKTDFKVINTH